MNTSRQPVLPMLAGAYGACLLALALLDAVWLGLVAADFYRAHLGHLMAEQPRFDAAIAFYLIYPAGVVLFAVRPAVESESSAKALQLGAAFGFFVYATYDLTNLATLRDWSVLVSVIDVAWGTGLSACISWLGLRAALAVARRSR